MIKNSLIILAILLFGSSAVAINYFRCEKEDDCVKAYGGCGRYLSVHVRYKELYEAKARKSDTMAFCLPPSEEDKERNEKGKVLCLKQECRLMLPEKK